MPLWLSSSLRVVDSSDFTNLNKSQNSPVSQMIIISERMESHRNYANHIFDSLTTNWQRMRPIWLMQMMNALTPSDIRNRRTPVLDLYLAQPRHEKGKSMGAVERASEQCEPLNTLNTSQVCYFIVIIMLNSE